MLNEGDFRDKLSKMVRFPDNFTKDEFYEAFLEMTERYLNELISNLNCENEIINQLGEEQGSALIEAIATNNPALDELYEENAEAEDIQDVIKNLIDFAEGEFGANIGEDGYDDDDIGLTAEDVERYLKDSYDDDEDDDDDEDEDEDDKD